VISILRYGCSTGAGDGVDRLWSGLVSGVDHSRPVDTTGWSVAFPGEIRASLLSASFPSQTQNLVDKLKLAWQETGWTPTRPVAVILASSKGAIEDVVWGETPGTTDSLATCLSAFIAATGIIPVRTAVVSNSCASSLAGLFLAAHWLKTEVVRDVLVLAADGFGPFVAHGFHSLGALSPTRSRPFATNRDGLRLGEAAACVWLSSAEASDLRLHGVGLNTEGHAVTRSEGKGESLRRAGQFAFKEFRPDLVIAHGTATRANDVVEDRVYSELWARPWVVGTKWSVGHTLGASGLVDVIVAAETIRRRRAFVLASTEVVDPEFRGRYLKVGDENTAQSLTPRHVAVASLGFGGAHGVVHVGVAE
jgi:3-oxoacyl-[acyl-carrier-protein] synthase-1